MAYKTAGSSFDCAEEDLPSCQADLLDESSVSSQLVGTCVGEVLFSRTGQFDQDYCFGLGRPDDYIRTLVRGRDEHGEDHAAAVEIN